jgi:hypothetical protein
MENPELTVERRSFVTRLSAGVAAFAAAMTAAGTSAQAQSDGTAWRPARHELDDWMDKLPGKHRMVFDTTTPDGFGHALLFANNFFIANQSGYGLSNSDVAVVIVARHNSTPFAYNDRIWGKYGAAISRQANFTDPKTKAAPSTNLFNATGYGDALPNLGVAMDGVLKRGAHLAVCQMATRFFAGTIARAVNASADDIYNELAANLVANSHLAPAGIVAVNRAQERGYTFVHA